MYPRALLPTPRSRAALQPWVFAVLVGLIGYCDFPLQWVLRSPLSPTRSYISELSVTGQPAYQVFRIGDLVAGVGLAVLAGVLVIWRPSSPMRYGSLALVVTASTSIIDGMAPMTCAPSIDAQCWAADHAPLSTQLLQLHTISGVIGFTAAVATVAAYGVALRGEPRTRVLGSIGLVLATIGAVLGCIEIATALTDTDWTGLFERIQVVVVSAYLATLTVVVARTTSPDLVAQPADSS
ncbi:DUF998 domain-containing protein [Mycolicibacterium llatzerense]|uniref:DUF998 domain-containing protein n=1 Tax=Mycolicibacterium llatzerense TaxID=280871 RepID=UPI0008DCB15E|nr:DUF998 domain-containing protein [Mycolicibacterium llatzerense]